MKASKIILVLRAKFLGTELINKNTTVRPYESLKTNTKSLLIS